jgi:hypothetical protein
LRTWEVTVASRNLQENTGQIVTLTFVEIGVFGGCFQALFELRDGS